MQKSFAPRECELHWVQLLGNWDWWQKLKRLILKLKQDKNQRNKNGEKQMIWQCRPENQILLYTEGDCQNCGWLTWTWSYRQNMSYFVLKFYLIFILFKRQKKCCPFPTLSPSHCKILYMPLIITGNNIKRNFYVFY